MSVFLVIVLILTVTDCETREEPYFSDIDPLTIQAGSIDTLIKQLSHPDRLKRKYACDGIAIYMRLQRGQDDVKAFTPIKEQLLREKDKIIQTKLMSLYISFPESLYREEDRELLLKIAADTSEYISVRRLAFQFFARMKDNRAIDLAMTIIKDAQSDFALLHSGQILGSAISYLGRVEYLPAIVEIKKILNILISHRSQIKGALEGNMFPSYLASLRFGYGTKIKSYLDSLLHNECDTVRFYAAIELGGMDENYVIPVLMEILEYPTINKVGSKYSIKHRAINVLDYLKVAKAIPLLKEFLNDKTEINGKLVVAEAAADALRHFGYRIEESREKPGHYEIIYEPPEYKELK